MNVFVSYKLRGLERGQVIKQLKMIQELSKQIGVKTYIYDLETTVEDPETNWTYFIDSLKEIKQAEEVRILHNHPDKSIGMMMEVAAAYALEKKVIVRRLRTLNDGRPYDMDQCARQIIVYESGSDLMQKITCYINSSRMTRNA